jgi:serine/threonine protein kinase
MNEVDTFHQRYSVVESIILILNIKHLINIYFIYFLFIYFFYFRYSTKSDIWAIGITMYEVIKLKNVFPGKNKDEIIKKTKNISKSGSYPKLEESEKLYNKEMINTINIMLNVYIISINFCFNFYLYFVFIINLFFIAN